MAYHNIVRTSPKGKSLPFVGYCVNCSRRGLSLSASRERCENTGGYSADDALLLVLEKEGER